MTRKSKQPGGHNPLTSHERKSLLGAYGTQSVRLGTSSHRRFGDCCLSLSPAVDPVVTPSGHVYSREAILSYLLSKTQELRELKAKEERDRSEHDRLQQQKAAERRQHEVAAFAQKDCGAASASMDEHRRQLQEAQGKTISMTKEEEEKRGLKRTSYWLSDFTPDAKQAAPGKGAAGTTSAATATSASSASLAVVRSTKGNADDDDDNDPKLSANTTIESGTPDRPPSPMSGQPLRRKDLTSVILNRADGPNGSATCAVSGKAITTQDVVGIKKTGAVMLKSVYDQLVLGGKKKKKKNDIDTTIKRGGKEKKEKLVCPVTGRTFKEKDVIRLVPGRSGFAATGEVTAKKYRPTLT